MSISRAVDLEAAVDGIPSVAYASEVTDDRDLSPAEDEALTASSAVRRAQFAAGRRCAKAGLRVLGWDGDSLLPGNDRRPCWPSGFDGSISHTRGRAVAIVAALDGLGPFRFGVDVEQQGRVSEHLHGRLFTESERRRLATLDEGFTTATFSAKEAFYKAQYALTESWVGFQYVEIIWDPERGRGDLWPSPGHAVGCFDQLAWPAKVALHRESEFVTTLAVVRQA